MVSQWVLGSAEMNIRSTAHGGGHGNEDWGGIPVVILFGDDFQLTPPCEEGAIDLLECPRCPRILLSTPLPFSEEYYWSCRPRNFGSFGETFQNRRWWESTGATTSTSTGVVVGPLSSPETGNIQDVLLNSSSFST